MLDTELFAINANLLDYLLRHYAADLQKVTGRSREKPWPGVRAAVWHVLRYRYCATVKQIGTMWRVDHSTVCCATNRARTDNQALIAGLERFCQLQGDAMIVPPAGASNLNLDVHISTLGCSLLERYEQDVNIPMGIV